MYGCDGVICYSHAIRNLNISPEPYLTFAVFEESHAELSHARELYEKVIAMAPQHVESSIQYCNFERRSKRYDRVIQIYQKCLAALTKSFRSSSGVTTSTNTNTNASTNASTNTNTSTSTPSTSTTTATTTSGTSVSNGVLVENKTAAKIEVSKKSKQNHSDLNYLFAFVFSVCVFFFTVCIYMFCVVVIHHDTYLTIKHSLTHTRNTHTHIRTRTHTRTHPNTHTQTKTPVTTTTSTMSKEQSRSFVYVSLHFARFLIHVKKDIKAAREVYERAFRVCPNQKILWTSCIHFESIQGMDI